MIANLLIAVLVFASVVGNVGNVVTNLRDRDNIFFPNHELVSWKSICVLSDRFVFTFSCHL